LTANFCTKNGSLEAQSLRKTAQPKGCGYRTLLCRFGCCRGNHILNVEFVIQNRSFWYIGQIAVNLRTMRLKKYLKLNVKGVQHLVDNWGREAKISIKRGMNKIKGSDLWQ